MKWVEALPRNVREIEHVWIPMADGVRLSARIWLPEDAEGDPVPAVLEYVPYRKNDGTAIGDAMRQRYLAGHGYAAIRVDLRGTGESEGLTADEYLPQEQDDGVAVIAWLAAQPWCSGRVGLWGISWGGFNALQIAARRPPALSAIITACSTDDRYADDVHYLGGSLLAYGLPWANTLLGLLSRPPDPRIVGEGWRATWLARLEAAHPPIEAWLRHARRDDYWCQGSVCEDFEAIACPVLAVGGWADAYTDTVFRLLEGLRVPCRAIVGPWSHVWPELGVPGPAIGFLQECVRWWDHWLKGRATRVLEEPELRAWMQESVSPGARDRERPGRWVAEGRRSPSPAALRLFPAAGSLRPAPEPPEVHPVETVLAHGSESGVWCPFGARRDLPGDQRADDARCLTFDAEPAAERQEILGHTSLSLRLVSDRPLAQICVRLCDVSPEGASLLVTRGFLNLTHRAGHADPEALEPGRSYDVRLRLGAISHALLPGHRWRLAIAPSAWPLVWPTPEAVRLALHTGEHSWLELPVREPRAEEDESVRFDEAVACPPAAHEVLRRPRKTREWIADPSAGLRVLESRYDGGRLRLHENGIELEGESLDRYEIREADPLSARITSRWSASLSRGDWQTRVQTESTLRAHADAFDVTVRLRAHEEERPVFERSWEFRIPRDHG